ncbi:MAG: hypothetical protein S4CHLAM7_03970 [Chlamydiae bacterium]|nr:hypothetical protein [Chlamydiota bacterium]
MSSIDNTARSLDLPRDYSRLVDAHTIRKAQEEKPFLDNKHVERVVNMTTRATLTEAIAETAIQIIRGFGRWISKKVSFLNTLKCNKLFARIGLPFYFSGGLVAGYALGLDAFAMRRAYHLKDSEAVRDTSMNITSNSASISGAVVSIELATRVIKESARQVARLSFANGLLSVGSFLIYSIMEAIKIARLSRSIEKMKTALKDDASLDIYENEFSKYRSAMKLLYESVGVTRLEEILIQEKTKDYSYGNKFLLKASRLMDRKEARLERRVGAIMAARIKEEAYTLLNQMSSTDIKTRTLAVIQADKLLKAYKAQVYRKFYSSLVGLTAGFLGTLGVVLSMVNPIGTMITSGVFILSALGLTIYSWYIEKHSKDKVFEKGVKIGSYTLSNYTCPNLDRFLENKKHPPLLLPSCNLYAKKKIRRICALEVVRNLKRPHSKKRALLLCA